MKDKVVGVVICDVERKEGNQEEPVGIFPEQFLKLERFFTDLKSNIDLFEEVWIMSFLEDISKLSSPGPKPFSPKPKTMGPWAVTKIQAVLHSETMPR